MSKDKEKLPYLFDLMYDCKTSRDVKRELERFSDTVRSYKVQYKNLHQLAREHGINVSKFEPTI